MPDDLDELLRSTMKTLDDQVPSGYFEALPERTLARLAGEGGTDDMQQGTSGPTTREPMSAMPPTTEPAALPKKRDDDSGLHDIRNLAQSTKQRLSSRRSSTHPPISDEDVLASSSASWKNLALPQPAKMVSLPELDELPSKSEVLAKEKAAKKERAAQAKTEAKIEATIEAKTAAEPGVAAPVESQAFASFKDRAPKKNSSRTIALVGMGLAAAAGAVLFVATRKTDDSKTAAPVIAKTDVNANAGLADKTKDLERATAELAAKHEAEQKLAEAEAAKTGGDSKVEAPLPPPPTPASKPAVSTKHVGKGKAADKPETTTVTAVDTTVETPKVEPKKATAGKGEPGDPSFDELLKEAGVDQKKEAKPKLEKKSLSGEDFKSGMGAIAAKAQACYKGTQGTATIKLTIAPTGHVSKVSVGGQFAGKTEADCVAAAVRGASFPAWDGGPQSFGYSYLLSE